jgi:hypothetical protein
LNLKYALPVKLRAGLPHLHLQVTMGKNKISFYGENKKVFWKKKRNKFLRDVKHIAPSKPNAVFAQKKVRNINIAE